MGILSSIIGGVTSIFAGGAAKKGIQQGVDTHVEGVNRGSDIMGYAYEEARKARLQSLAKIGALTPEQLEQTLTMLDQGHSQYVDEVITAGEGYAFEMGDGGAAYRQALTGAGVGYENSMGDVVAQYGDEITQVAQELGIDFDTAAQLYKEGLDTNATDFGGRIEGSARDFGGQIEGSARDFGAGVDASSKGYADTTGGGLSAIKSTLQPYQEGRGTDSLDMLNRLAQQDPATLSPSQARMREEFLRDSAARLASSSLRGAGRAGVAAVNEGDAELRARQYDENLARSITAANQLADYGYGASGTIGAAELGTARDTAVNTQRNALTSLGAIRSARDTGAAAQMAARDTGARYAADATATGLASIKSASDAGAKARYDAEADAAAKALTSGQDVAKTQLNLGTDAAKNDQDVTQKIAGTNLAIGQDIAQQGIATTDKGVKALGTAYDQARDVATQEGDANVNAFLGTGAAAAGATTDGASVAAQGAINKGKINAETIGDVGGSVADIVSKLPI